MTTKNQNPEQIARDRIDQLLRESGWIVQPKDKINLGAGLGVAIREYQTDSGPADYVLFVGHKPVGIIEAKREEEGVRLTVVEEQSNTYADSTLKYLNNDPLPFVFETTGLVTRFTDRRDPKCRSRPIFSFQRPETIQDWMTQGRSLRSRLQDLPELNPDGLRQCQINAITNLEMSFKASRLRAVVQMATGSGKTFTAITSIYRLLKHTGAKRILVLVDTKNLGEQAEQEFMAYTPNDDNRKFTELYNVQRLKSRFIAEDSQVCISTIQRVYSILKGVDLDEKAEEDNPHELLQPKEPMPVVYDAKIPVEYFDFIVIDECHRSIYNVWQQVLDYFDAFLIGLTATPDKRTFGFFNENVVSEYPHEEAVVDGVNVQHFDYVIETEISRQGAALKASEQVKKREKLTRRQRWDQLEEDLTYSSKQLDRSVVNPSQIRRVVRTFRDKLPEIFPHREEVPKTLIFAKSDSHADDIIQTVRDEFGEGNEFCRKVTYREKDPKGVLAAFRTEYYPRIAVTVDMIATGTDVKPLECLLFMRDVRSHNYFEQMKGRGTRTLGYDDLKKVTPSVKSAKTHFVIVDAVGVTQSKKSDSVPLERKKSVPIKDLMMGIMMGAQEEEAFVSLAGRLSRLNQQMDHQEHVRLAELTGGVEVTDMARALLTACSADAIQARARDEFEVSKFEEPREDQLKAAQESLMREAASLFTGEIVEYLDTVQRVHEQVIDTVNLDRVVRAEWDGQAQEQAESLVQDFAAFIEANRDEIEALKIFYGQPFQRRMVTFAMVREVLEILKVQKLNLAPLHVWEAYCRVEQVQTANPLSELTALMGLIRRVTGLDQSLTLYSATVNRNFQRWVFQKQSGALKFNELQMDWLRMIKDHMVSSFHIEAEDLDYAPFDGQGGLGQMYELFGDEMDRILEEMNQELVA